MGGHYWAFNDRESCGNFFFISVEFVLNFDENRDESISNCWKTKVSCVSLKMFNLL